MICSTVFNKFKTIVYQILLIFSISFIIPLNVNSFGLTQRFYDFVATPQTNSQNINQWSESAFGKNVFFASAISSTAKSFEYMKSSRVTEFAASAFKAISEVMSLELATLRQTKNECNTTNYIFSVAMSASTCLLPSLAFEYLIDNFGSDGILKKYKSSITSVISAAILFLKQKLLGQTTDGIKISSIWFARTLLREMKPGKERIDDLVVKLADIALEAYERSEIGNFDSPNPIKFSTICSALSMLMLGVLVSDSIYHAVSGVCNSVYNTTSYIYEKMCSIFVRQNNNQKINSRELDNQETETNKKELSQKNQEISIFCNKISGHIKTFALSEIRKIFMLHNNGIKKVHSAIPYGEFLEWSTTPSSKKCLAFSSFALLPIILSTVTGRNNTTLMKIVDKICCSVLGFNELYFNVIETSRKVQSNYTPLKYLIESSCGLIGRFISQI